MADKSLRSSLRPQSVDNRVLNPNVFPFDAFKFDDPNRVENPVLRMKDPWSFEAGEIEAGSITTDKLAIGVVGTIYNQPLAPNTVFLGDVWIDSDDDQYHIPYGGEIDYSVGGAGADVTGFDSIVGGAGADVETFEEEYGNIPAYAGWIQSAYAPGTTLIDGGMIETDSLKSANYVEGVSGSKFDLASGYIETGSGVYRGDLSANELISGAIHSPDFVIGTSGWNIDSDGTVEFNNGIFRGNITGASGTFTGDLVTPTFAALASPNIVATKNLVPSDGHLAVLYYDWVVGLGLSVGIKYACTGSYNGTTITAIKVLKTASYLWEVYCWNTADVIIEYPSGFGYTFAYSSYDGGSYDVAEATTNVTFTTGGDTVKFFNLPSSSVGLASKQVYSDSGVLKITS